MTKERYMKLGLEKDRIDTLEHIDDLEGIFWDFGEKRDARQLITLYDNYLEMTGFNDSKSSDILKKRNEMISYLSKVNGKQLEFFEKIYGNWKK